MINFFRYYWFTFKVQKVSMEWDILILLPQWKLIINIEVKRGAGLSPLKHAVKQTEFHLDIFRKIFGAHLSSEWKFIKAACTPNLHLTGESNPCDYCTQFILSGSEMLNMSPWIERIIANGSFEVEAPQEYKDLLVGIIGFSSIRQSNELNKLIVDPHEFSKETEFKITNQTSAIQGENEENRHILQELCDTDKESKVKKSKGKKIQSEYLCYMLTPDQLMAVKDPSSLIIIEGDYGCGKTYVLKERTKQCAEKYPGSKIAYINITTDAYRISVNKNIMDIIAENNFKDYSNVDVVTAKDMYDHYSKHRDQLNGVSNSFVIYGGECSLLLKHFLEHSTYDHIFIDEMPPFKKISYELFLTNKTYCVTMKCDIFDDNINEEWIIQMVERYNAKRIILKHNMRNSATIMNLSNCFDRNNVSKKKNLSKANVIPNKNIIGPVCYHYSNIHDLTNFFLVGAAIQKYFPQQKESLVVLNSYLLNAQNLYADLQEYFTTTREIVFLPEDDKYPDYEKHIVEVKEYLENPEGILITDTRSFQGAQARNIIIIADHHRFNIDFHLRNMILRTMSFVIIIYGDEIEESVPGLVRDENLHEYINSGNTEQIFCHNEDDEHRSICHLPFKEQDSDSDLAVTEEKEDEDLEDTKED